MLTGDAEFLKRFEADMVSLTETSAKRKRYNAINKSTVEEEKNPTAQNYYKRFVSDIMVCHAEMMTLKKEKYVKDMAFKEKELQIRKQELELKRQEIELMQKEIESRERMQILDLEMKRDIAMEELKLKYRQNN